MANFQDIVGVFTTYAVYYLNDYLGFANYIHRSGQQQCHQWELEDLPELALNLAARNNSPREEYGDKFDFSLMPSSFNSGGKILVDYIRNNPKEGERLLVKLETEVNDLRKERTQSSK